jgi:hypothetical protein
VNWILSKVAGPWLVYAILGLMVLLGAQHIALRITRAQLEAKTEAYNARGESVKNLAGANLAWLKKYEALRGTHEHLLKENLRMDREAQAALVERDREYASLERTFEKFKKQFDNKSVGCAAALSNINKMCPNLKGY